MRQSKYNLEMVLEYIEQNQIEKVKDLPVEYRNYIYRTNQYDKLPFHKERQVRNKSNKSKDRLLDWYDLSKILPYLERWSIMEGTTVEFQAIQGALKPEWKQWCIDHPEYKGR